jgi:hypothetical protein
MVRAHGRRAGLNDLDSLSTGEINNAGSNILLGDTLEPDAEFAPLLKRDDTFLDFTASLNVDDATRVKATDVIDRFNGAIVLSGDSTNTTGIFRVSTGKGLTSVSAASDFSTTQDNQGTINVYDDLNAVYIENETGGSQTLTWWVIAGGR